MVLTWLRLIHPGLPKLVKQYYGTELRSWTLASIKADISQALDSLIDELQTTEESRIMRSNMFTRPSTKHLRSKSRGFRQTPRTQGIKVCPLCKQGGQIDNHFLSACSFLPESDRHFMTKTRQTSDILEDYNEGESDEENNDCAASHRI